MKERIKKYFLENKVWFSISLGTFLSGIVLGFVLVLVFPSVLEKLLDFLSSTFEEEIASLLSHNNLKTTALIFLNNIKSSLVLSIGGLVFGFLTLFGLFFNGLILGIIGGALVLSGEVVLLFLTLTPHGVFEIPAVLFAASWGLRFGLEWMLDKHKGKRKAVFKANLKGFVSFLPVLILLLVIAAFIEVYISGTLATKFG